MLGEVQWQGHSPFIISDGNFNLTGLGRLRIFNRTVVRRVYYFIGPSANIFVRVRKYMVPSATAGVACVFSPKGFTDNNS